jgi:hypothetical protein
MSTTPTPEPDSPTSESSGIGCPMRFSVRFALAAGVVVAVATAGIVFLSAFTSWWVLFALFGVLPPLMMLGCLAMMSAIRGRITIGSCFAGPCTRWFDAGVGRAASWD